MNSRTSTDSQLDSPAALLMKFSVPDLLLKRRSILMKMTMDIDDDVATEILEVHESEPDKSFEQIVNELFRIGLGIDDENNVNSWD